MAVTGTGTMDDPILVSNYEELKANISAGQYVKLIADIDCNDYGANFKWEGLNVSSATTSSGVSPRFLDLGGHTIRNVVLPSNVNMFVMSDTRTVLNISNGKILNVFSENATRVFQRVAGTNLTMSINGNGMTGAAFDGCTLAACSVYFKTSKLSNLFINGNLSDCDIYLDIADINKQMLNYRNNTITSIKQIFF